MSDTRTHNDENASDIDGELADDHEYTPKIRRIANEIIKGDEWPLEDVDLSKIKFKTNTQAQRRRGRAELMKNGETAIQISESNIQKDGWESAEETIRHELVHAWQHQHRNETVELPNGVVVDDIEVSHTGAWYDWEELMDIRRTTDDCQRPRSEYNYVLQCPDCNQYWGRYKMCPTVRSAADGSALCSECKTQLYVARPDDLIALPHGDWSDYAIRQFVSGNFPGSNQRPLEAFVLKD